MADRKIIVVGASLGGVEAVRELSGRLPSDLAASVLVVVHVGAVRKSLLPEIMQRVSKLPVHHPADGAKLEPGHIYIAPPNHHMMVEDSRIYLVRGPKVNRHRPSIDVMFRSAAANFGGRVIGAILTGSLDDGSAGLLAIKKAGGLTVVQDPSDAMASDMPRNAIRAANPHHIVPLAEIPGLLAELARQPAPAMTAAAVAGDGGKTMSSDQLGAPSVFTCPECHGTLWETTEGQVVHFRCRVGHSYSLESMDEARSEDLEKTLWAAVRALEESADLARRMAENTLQRVPSLATRMEKKAADRKKHAALLRDFLVGAVKEADTA